MQEIDSDVKFKFLRSVIIFLNDELFRRLGAARLEWQCLRAKTEQDRSPFASCDIFWRWPNICIFAGPQNMFT